jgi:NAD(P)-dependent dehydrogenase (short-subunit alcohol dehydrogenase family)
VVDTSMSRHAFDHLPDPSEAYQAVVDRHPLGRIAEASEIAGVIAHLASTDASFMTGQAVAVDGGRTATG